MVGSGQASKQNTKQTKKQEVLLYAYSRVQQAGT